VGASPCPAAAAAAAAAASDGSEREAGEEKRRLVLQVVVQCVVQRGDQRWDLLCVCVHFLRHSMQAGRQTDGPDEEDQGGVR